MSDDRPRSSFTTRDREESGAESTPDGSDSSGTDTGERESAAEPALDEESTTGAAGGRRGGGGHGDESRRDGGRLSGTLGVLISALVGLVVTGIAYWVVQGIGPFFEEYPRVQPTVENRGVGSDWIVGNTDPALDAMIALVHAADVIMGVFILVMVFLHWAAFRRLAGRMARPTDARRTEDAVAADGGESGLDPGRDRERERGRDAEPNRSADADRGGEPE